MGPATAEERKKFPEVRVVAVQSWSLSVAVGGSLCVSFWPGRPVSKETGRQYRTTCSLTDSYIISHIFSSPSTINMLRTLQGTWDSKKDGPCSHWALRNRLLMASYGK